MNDWISINDKLPEDRQRVMVYGNRSKINIALFRAGIDGGIGDWMTDESCLIDINYWIPLPNQPE